MAAKPELDELKLLYRTSVDCIRKLDAAVKERKISALFRSEALTARAKLQTACERLMFLGASEYERKAEDSLWKKAFYETLAALRKAKERLNPEERGWAALLLSSAQGHYLQLAARADGRPGLRQRCFLRLGDLARYEMELGDAPANSEALAELYYFQALAIDPDQGMAWNQLGTLHFGADWGLHATACFLRCSASAVRYDGSKGNLRGLLEKNSKKVHLNEPPPSCESEDFVRRLLHVVASLLSESPVADQLLRGPELSEETSALCGEVAQWASDTGVPTSGVGLLCASPTLSLATILLLLHSRLQDGPNRALCERLLGSLLRGSAKALLDACYELPAALDATVDSEVTAAVSTSEELDESSLDVSRDSAAAPAEAPVSEPAKEARNTPPPTPAALGSDSEGEGSARPRHRRRRRGSSSGDSGPAEEEEEEDVLELPDSEEEEEMDAAEAEEPERPATEELVSAPLLARPASPLLVSRSVSSADAPESSRDRLVSNSGLLPALALILDWLCGAAAERVPRLQADKGDFWGPLTQLLNRLPNAQELLAILGVEDVGLPEDALVRGLGGPVLGLIRASSSPPSSPLSPSQLTLARVRRLRSLAAALAAAAEEAEDMELGFALEDGLFYSTHQPAIVPTEEDRRQRMMSNMAKAFYKEEMAEMERLGWIPVYLVVDSTVLTRKLRLLEQLLSLRRFVIVVPVETIRRLDEDKKSGTAVREAIRWLERVLGTGDKFLRAQKPEERLALPADVPGDEERRELLACTAHLCRTVQPGGSGSVVACLLSPLPPAHPDFSALQEAVTSAEIYGASVASVDGFWHRWQRHDRATRGRRGARRGRGVLGRVR